MAPTAWARRSTSPSRGPATTRWRLDEILARLKDATEVELAVVDAYEREHEARQAILLAAGEEV